jgi:phosphotransferase system enzyme I (PtsP)
VRVDIESVAANLRDKLSPEDLALFDVYLGILDDSTIGGEVAALIKSGQWAQGALAQVMIEHIRHFEAMEHSYLRERAVDVKDLGERVLGYLQAEQRDDQDFPEQTILVSEDLTASMLGEIPRNRLAGLVSVRGSGNSHVAILARAMGVPTVMGAVDLPYTRLRDMSLVVDGYNGNVHLNPTPEALERFREIADQDVEIARDLEALRESALRDPGRQATDIVGEHGPDGGRGALPGARRRGRGPVSHRSAVPHARALSLGGGAAADLP